MPVLAPVAPRIHHGPVVCRRRRRRSLPLHALTVAAAAAARSAADDDYSRRPRTVNGFLDSADVAAATKLTSALTISAPPTGTGTQHRQSAASCPTLEQHPARVPTRLSLRGLLQSENVHAIQDNIAVLARFASHLPLDVNTHTAPVDDDELLVMGKLVRDIGSSLDKIGALRDEEEQALPGVMDKYVPVRPVSCVARRRQKEKMKLKLAHKCHNCNRLETPQWRPGPDGPKTLCNVCGLVYTKRQQRHAQQAGQALREE